MSLEFAVLRLIGIGVITASYGSFVAVQSAEQARINWRNNSDSEYRRFRLHHFGIDPDPNPRHAWSTEATLGYPDPTTGKPYVFHCRDPLVHWKR